MSSNAVLIANKAYGATPLETIEALRRLHVLTQYEKVTYAGRLDPLATGVLVLLRGEEVHQKETYLALQKTYEIELAFGVSTDTGDLLGIPQEGESKLPSIEQIRHVLESVTEIQYPLFSSKTVDGKALHTYAREGVKITRPSRAAQFRITHASSIAPITSEQIKEQAVHACELVKGDFRQETIRDAWQKAKIPATLPRYAFTINATAGTYMRAIPEILKKQFGTHATVTKIHRTQVGEFSI